MSEMYGPLGEILNSTNYSVSQYDYKSPTCQVQYWEVKVEW